MNTVIQIIQIGGSVMQLSGKGNIYEQIIEYFEKYIKLQVIRPGEKLPSVREFAKENGINPNTVQKAYIELEKKGYIQIVEKKGAFVISDEEKEEKKLSTLLIQQLFDEGVSYEEVIKTVNEIYGGKKDHDRD